MLQNIIPYAIFASQGSRLTQFMNNFDKGYSKNELCALNLLSTFLFFEIIACSHIL